MIEDLMELSAVSKKLKENNILSKSTLYKIASENYDGPLFADFPRPRRIGGKWFWRWSEIEDWLAAQWDAAATPKKEKEKEKSPIAVGFGRGRPSRSEENAAAAAGLTVKEWRRSAQAGVCHA
jgi:predicted DNA-binding transcriptional regulator AlpA